MISDISLHAHYQACALVALLDHTNLLRLGFYVGSVSEMDNLSVGLMQKEYPHQARCVFSLQMYPQLESQKAVLLYMDDMGERKWCLYRPALQYAQDTSQRHGQRALISEQSNSSNFINWLENNGLSTELSPTDDSDKDGLPLLLEYAFDTDPLSFSPNPLKVEENEGQKTVTFPNVRSELNYLIETSEDIITWGTESVDQETGILSNEPDKLFIRVKVTQ